jgi:uncharacterized protein (DUF2344 family)
LALSGKGEGEEKSSLKKKRITEDEFLAEFRTAEGGTYTIRVIKQRKEKQVSERE